MIPENYAAWRRCIEVDCGIVLTAAFAKERIARLMDKKDPQTQQFREKYGDAYAQQVVDWFTQALQQLPAASLPPMH